MLGFRKPIKINEDESKIVTFFKNNIGIITSIIFGTIYLGAEYFLVIYFIS